MHQTLGQLVGAWCWFRGPWSKTRWWTPFHKRHLMGKRQLVRGTLQQLDGKGLRGWQLASGSKWSRQHSTTKDWQVVVVLMAGAKRHLELKECLQLGGYASSYGSCGSCITTKQAPWSWILNCNYRVSHIKGPYISETEDRECHWMLKGSKHCTLTQAKC